MSLSCSCDYDSGDGGEYWYSPDDYSVMPDGRRRKRCSSCGSLINHGATVAIFERWCEPRTDIEERIHGEGASIPLAPYHLCEICADLYFSLYELGFECVGPGDDMRELVREYHEVYGQAAADGRKQG